MRVSALIQLSALAACPLALLTVDSIGDSRVPSPPSTPTPPENISPEDSALADLSTSVMPPEAFVAGAERIDRPMSSVNQSATGTNFQAKQQKTQNVPNLPNPALLPVPQSAQAASSGFRAVPHSFGQPSSPTSVPATPEDLDIAWDRLIARSIGLDEAAFAANRATTPQSAPAEELLPEAAALDSQTADANSTIDPAPQSTASLDEQATAQANLPATQETAPAEIQQTNAASVATVTQAVEGTALTLTNDAPTAALDSAIDPSAEPAVTSDDVQPTHLNPTVATVEAMQTTEPAPVMTVAQPEETAAKPVAQAEIPSGSEEAATLASLSARVPQAAVNPVLTGVIDQNYRLGPGDVIQVNLFNVPEYSGAQRVLVDGTVNLPAVGSVSVTGLSLSEAEQTIAAAYGRELRNIRVTVNLVQSRPLRVGVAGEVRQPGYYVLASSDAQLPSVAQAIQTAGGVTQLADLRQVQVRRVGQNGVPEMIMVNLWALLEQGDPTQNLTLRDGDTIVIAPTTSMNAAETEQLAASNLASTAEQAVNIALTGEVGRPGAYKLTSTAGNRATLTQAIQAAGGVTPEADLRKVQVQRTARNGTVQMTTLDLWQLVTTGDLSQDLILQPGDRITVAKAEAMTPEEMARVTASNVSPSNIRVNIVGEATSPGAVQVPANTTLNQALLAAGGFNRRARRTVQLIRINPNGSLTQREIEIDLNRPVNPETNPILFNNDVIVVRRNGLANFTDGANSILEPFFRILPIFGLF